MPSKKHPPRDWGGYVAAIRPDPPTPRTACPIDGEPLDIKDGILHCPRGNWVGKVGDTA